MKTIILTGLMVISLTLQISCKTDNDNIVTDIDGNHYHTVTIGTQVWMVENLKVTKYRNGDIIGTTTPDSLCLDGESTPKYQWAYDGDESMVADYGRLYTWHTIKDNRNLCPVGWHIPSNDEWRELTDYLGGESIAGSKLKEVGMSHWLSMNSDATNETGFTAIPGGYRSGNGIFYAMGYEGFWWSATERNTFYAYGRTMEIGYTNVILDEDPKQSGFSVRCVKD